MEKIFLENAAAALAGAFPEVMLVTERVRQGAKAPCMVLALKRCTVRREMGERFRGEAVFRLRYEPEREDAYEGAGVLRRVGTALRRCPGFSGMEGSIGTGGTVRMTLRFSAVGFQSGEPAVKMAKMGMRLDFSPHSKKAGG